MTAQEIFELAPRRSDLSSSEFGILETALAYLYRYLTLAEQAIPPNAKAGEEQGTGNRAKKGTPQ